MNYNALDIIDLSQFQGKVDYGYLAAHAHAVIMRSSYGRNLDGAFNINKAGCKAAGIVFGVYHFCNPDSDAKKQGQYFGSLDTGDLPPVMDCEYAGAASASLVSGAAMNGSYNIDICNGARQQEPAASAYGLSKSQLIAWYEKFIEAFEVVSGRQPMIYTSAGFWNFTAGWEKNYKLWVANYTTAAEPLMPAAWKPPANPDKFPWRLWQWSADGNHKGAEYGCASRDVDLDRYHGTIAEFEAEFRVKLPDLEPAPPPPPSPVGEYQVIAQPFANLRTEPEVEAHNDIGDLMPGTKIKPYKIVNGWAYLPETWVSMTTLKKVG